jgi:hypothetical protein
MAEQSPRQALGVEPAADEVSLWRFLGVDPDCPLHGALKSGPPPAD